MESPLTMFKCSVISIIIDLIIDPRHLLPVPPNSTTLWRLAAGEIPVALIPQSYGSHSRQHTLSYSHPNYGDAVLCLLLTT